jgi:hypothetical protein
MGLRPSLLPGKTLNGRPGEFACWQTLAKWVFELNFRFAQTNWFDSNGQFCDESMRYRDEDNDVATPGCWMNLDATRNMGYPAREGGKYGSHPAHDRFDDESEP